MEEGEERTNVRAMRMPKVVAFDLRKRDKTMITEQLLGMFHLNLHFLHSINNQKQLSQCIYTFKQLTQKFHNI